MLEPYTQNVLLDIDTIVDIEFSRLGLLRKSGARTIVGLCTDGVVAGVVTVDLSGKPSSLVVLQVSEDTMSDLPESDLLPYFQRNREHASQTMGEYCRLVSQGMKDRNASPN